MPNLAVPRFFLYGEPPRAPGERFVHLEEIDDRARPAAWHILPHAHADLHQVFAIRSGGGSITADSAVIHFEAPAVLLVPAGTNHGFRFEAGTAGKVLTLSEPLLQQVVRSDPDFAPLFEAVRRLSPIDVTQLGARLDALEGEIEATAAGRRGALAAHVTLVLVALARALEGETAPLQAQLGAHAEIVARFRQAVEERFHEQDNLGSYCRRLGITMGRLRLACRAVAGTTPGRIVADRVILEAKRALAYSERPIAEIAYGLGFSDAAYFARYFARQAGRPPSAFRRISRDA